MADLSIGKLAAMLKPYILDLIGSATGGVGPFAPTPHDLTSSHHSGSISDAQGPQFLKTDGGRQLLGNLSVATGITVDGVDISVLKGDFDAHLSGGDPHSQYVRKANADTISAVHTFNPPSAGAPFTLGANAQSQVVTGLRADELSKSISAGTGLTGGGALTANRTLGIDLTANLTWTGNEAFQGGLTTRHILPEVSDAYDIGSSEKLWRRVYASELDTFLLVGNAVSVIGGKLVIAKSEGTLPAGVNGAQTAIDFGAAMTANHIILFRTLGQVEYMKIVSLSSGTTYNVTRNLDGSGTNDWPAGAVWLNLGYSGTGRIELDAESTPRISIKRQGTAYNTLLGEPVRIGDLNGWDDVGTERYGIGLGDFAGGNYLRYEPGAGFDLIGGSGGLKVDSSGLGLLCVTSGSYEPQKSISFFTAGFVTPIAKMYAFDDTMAYSQFLHTVVEGQNAYDSISVMGSSNAGFGVSSSAGKTGSFSLDASASLTVFSVNTEKVSLNIKELYLTSQEDGAPIITVRDASAAPATPASNFTKMYFRNGSPYIKRSSGAIHPLLYADALFEELPWFYLWGVGSRTYHPELRCVDKLGSGVMLYLNGVGNEVYSAQLGNRVVGNSVFNGTSSYMSYPSAPNMVVATTHFLAGGWFYLDSINRNHGLMQMGNTTQMFELYVNSGNAAAFRTYHGTTGYVSAGAITGAGWHFIVGRSQWWSSASYYEQIFIDGTWYNYSGGAPTSTCRTPVGEFRIGRAYNDSFYLQGRAWRTFYGYCGGVGSLLIPEYYALTKDYFQ